MFDFLKKNNSKSVNVNDMTNILGKVELIDIREPYEYKAGHLPTAKNIPMGEVLANPDDYFDKNKEYHIICQSGNRSGRVCTALSAKGYNLINVAGGTGGYKGKLDK